MIILIILSIVLYFVISVFSMALFKKLILSNTNKDSCFYCSCSECASMNYSLGHNQYGCTLWKIMAALWPISYILMLFFFGGKYLSKIFDKLLNKF